MLVKITLKRHILLYTLSYDIKTHAFSPPSKLIENIDALNLGDSLLFQNQCIEYALLWYST